MSWFNLKYFPRWWGIISGEDHCWAGLWRVGIVVIGRGSETPLQEVEIAVVTKEESGKPCLELSG